MRIEKKKFVGTYLADPIGSSSRRVRTMLAPQSIHIWYLEVNLNSINKAAIERLSSTLFPLCGFRA